MIRLGLHPVDMRHEFSRTYWLQTLKRLLDEGRVPMTKAHWLALHSAAHGSRRMSRGILLLHRPARGGADSLAAGRQRNLVAAAKFSVELAC